MNRKYAYAKLTEEEQTLFEKALEASGYRNRTDFYTACAHLLLYGQETRELIREHQNISLISKTMETFMQVIEEMAFPIIAMRGISTVHAFLLDDIKQEMYKRCGTFPDDLTLKNWLKIYANINRSRLDTYCSEIRIRRYLDTQEAGAE